MGFPHVWKPPAICRRPKDAQICPRCFGSPTSARPILSCKAAGEQYKLPGGHHVTPLKWRKVSIRSHGHPVTHDNWMIWEYPRYPHDFGNLHRLPPNGSAKIMPRTSLSPQRKCPHVAPRCCALGLMCSMGQWIGGKINRKPSIFPFVYFLSNQSIGWQLVCCPSSLILFVDVCYSYD